MATDLTFQNLNTISPIFTLVDDDIQLSLSALTGKTYTALTNEGVILACFNLLQNCVAAQSAVNEGETSPNLLAAFIALNNASTTIAADGTILLGQEYRVVGNSTLNIDGVLGVNA